MSRLINYSSNFFSYQLLKVILINRYIARYNIQLTFDTERITIISKNRKLCDSPILNKNKA